MVRSRFAVTLVALAAIACVAPAASQAAEWTPCTFTMLNEDCATYQLPLDRTGVFPGTTSVRAMRVAAPEGPRLGTLFVIAGGPGQGAQEMVGFMAALFGGANRYDIVAVDQRGSGASEPLNCPRLESGDLSVDGNDPKSDKYITGCSEQLGTARYSYNTAEAVADLEAVRADLGVDQISLFGVSYGTKVAMAYAKQYPEHSKALLIDSVLPVEEPSTFDLAAITASRRALTEICGGRACRGVNSAPIGGLAKLSSRLAKNPLPTFAVTPDGKVKDAKIDAEALYTIVLEADFNLFIYNQLPGAITSALRGNTAQLERLYAIVFGLAAAEEFKSKARKIARKLPRKKRKVQRKPGAPVVGRDAETLALFSNTMNVATNCADFNPPWTRGTNLSGRQEAIEAAANAIPDAGFHPFERTTVRNQSLATICRGWQQSDLPPALPTGPLPAVPTLALNGSLDLRTPLEWAQRAVAGNPLAEMRPIPHTGHSVIGTDVSGCAVSLAKRFLTYGATDGKCFREPPALPVAPLPKNTLTAVEPLSGSCRGLRGKRCRAARKSITAGYLALRDTIDQFAIGGMLEGPGLYGGNWTIEFDFSDDLTSLIPIDVALESVSNVPGSFVSGDFSLESFPRAEGGLRVSDDTGDWRVAMSGKFAYDRRSDSLTLRATQGRKSVTLRIRPRGKASRARVSASQLKLRTNYMRAVGLGPAGSLAR